MATSEEKTFILGLSGLSSSGKTTLSRLLRSVFGPSSFILHQDDFYQAEEKLPVVDGLVDWDCVESIDFPAMLRALNHIHDHGELPGDLDSKEDQNTTGENRVSPQEVEEVRRKVEGSGVKVKLAILDGFLLFHDDEVMGKLDARIFLRAPYEKAKQRREARSGYVTLEGFWTDPPGYFNKIVWPNYVKSHQHLFVGEDVAGDLNSEFLERKRIHSPAEVDLPMNKILPWAVDIILDEAKRRQALAT